MKASIIIKYITPFLRWSKDLGFIPYSFEKRLSLNRTALSKSGRNFGPAFEKRWTKNNNKKNNNQRSIIDDLCSANSFVWT